MNEAADAANHVSAILILWFWCTLLSFLDVIMRIRAADDAKQPGQAASAADAAPAIEDERFAEILRLDPAFSLEAFLDGARKAYEIVLEAYAAADIETLKPLLSREVLAAFEQACAERTRRGETIEMALDGIDGVDVVNAGVSPDAMEVSLRFRAQLVWTEHAADGSTIGGDPSRVADMAETWTFARPIPVASNAWTVVATGT